MSSPHTGGAERKGCLTREVERFQSDKNRVATNLDSRREVNVVVTVTRVVVSRGW